MRLFATALLVSVISTMAIGQTTGGGAAELPGPVPTFAELLADSGIADKSPSENARGGSVAARSPSRMVSAARAQHQQFQQVRVNLRRSNPGAEIALPTPTTGTTGSSGTTGNVLIDSLLGNLGGLGGLLGNLGGTGTTGTGTTGSNIPSNIPQEAIDLLRNAGIDVNSLFAKQINDATESPKTDTRAQTTGEEEQEDFLPRLYTSWVQTAFTALTVGFQAPAFIDAVAEFLRPAFGLPPTSSETTTNGENTGGGGVPAGQ